MVIGSRFKASGRPQIKYRTLLPIKTRVFEVEALSHPNWLVICFSWWQIVLSQWHISLLQAGLEKQQAQMESCLCHLARRLSRASHLLQPNSVVCSINEHLLTHLQLVNRRSISPLSIARLPRLSMGPPNPATSPHRQIRSTYISSRTPSNRSLHLRLLTLRRPSLSRRHDLSNTHQISPSHQTNRHRHHSSPTNHQHNLLIQRRSHHLWNQQRLHQHHRNLVPENHSLHKTLLWHHLPPPSHHERPANACKLFRSYHQSRRHA